MAIARPYHHGNLRGAMLERAEAILRDRGVGDLSLRELARDVGVSHAAPRRHFADRQALLDALAEVGFARLGEQLRAAAEVDDLEARMQSVGLAYVRFATQDAALLELMFAGKHREPAGPLHEAAYDAFGVVLQMIVDGQAAGVLEAGESETVGLALFATMQGMAAMVNNGMLEAERVDAAVQDAVARFVRGSRPR